MCRLYGLRANEPTKVECTLVYAQNALLRQSRADLRGKDHSDGWGIACYREGAPVVERRSTAAHGDVHFSTAAERVYSVSVLAHVRRATVGRAREENTHPFAHGPWIFAHNGTLRGIDTLGPQLGAETPEALRRLRRGDTDSERVFLWLLGRMEERGHALTRPTRDSGGLSGLVSGAVRELAERAQAASEESPSKLNFLLTDGRTLIATRWGHSLHFVRRDGIRDCDICGIPHVHHDPDARYRAVVVASEPISSEPWEEVADHSVVAVDPDLSVTVTSA